MRILAADIGGTHTRLALFRSEADRLEPLVQRTVPSADHDSLADLLEGFLSESGGPVEAAALGIAGPVLDGAVDVTNLPWRVREAEIADVLGTRRVRLLNDLEANAWGMLQLGGEDFAVIQRGTRPARGGTIAVVAAGTGFGEAALFWDGERHHPMATEAGHTSWAPRNDLELRLLADLRARHGHVSLERVVSGPGLVAIHRFLCAEAGVEAETGPGDPGAAITRAGLAGSDPRCVDALALFVEAYGAAAGDAALRHLAAGGVWIAGGIAPKLLSALREGAFLEAFRDKGRFRPLLESLPVAVCTATDPGLHGAAHFALQLARA